MKLFNLRRPTLQNCADVAPVGSIGYRKCETCGYFIEYPKPAKRVVEWLEGADRVCDFVWPARLVSEVLVVDKVKHILENKGAEFVPSEYYQDPKLRKPKQITKRTNQRMWIPYEGTPLMDLWIPTWVHADLEKSTLILKSQCPVCGHKVYDIEGIEVYTHRYDLNLEKLADIHIPREKNKGIYIHQDSLPEGVEIFRLYEQPGRIFCTERLKEEIEKSLFENILYLEVGEILG